MPSKWVSFCVLEYKHERDFFLVSQLENLEKLLGQGLTESPENYYELGG